MLRKVESRAGMNEYQQPTVSSSSEHKIAEARETGAAAKLGSSVFVKGELTGSEDLTVDGRVEGRIELPEHTLTIGPNANIQADIVAKAVTVFGSVAGEITAPDKLDIRRGGSLAGHVVCGRIAIQDGALFSGHVEMSPALRRDERQAENA